MARTLGFVTGVFTVVDVDFTCVLAVDEAAFAASVSVELDAVAFAVVDAGAVFDEPPEPQLHATSTAAPMHATRLADPPAQAFIHM